MKCTWLQESYVDWIFHGPEVACLLINLFFLIRIMWVNEQFLIYNSLIKTTYIWKCIVKVLIIKLRSAATAETRQYNKASKALLVLIPLLGITYLVVWYVPENGAASAIRAALLSTQVNSITYLILLYCFIINYFINILYFFVHKQTKKGIFRCAVVLLFEFGGETSASSSNHNLAWKTKYRNGYTNGLS